MTEEELAIAGTTALSEAVRCQDSPDATVACIATGDCDCFGCARAVLAAVGPKIRAEERERAAKVADTATAAYRRPIGTYDKAARNMAAGIAAAIRAGKEEAGER